MCWHEYTFNVEFLCVLIPEQIVQKRNFDFDTCCEKFPVDHAELAPNQVSLTFVHGPEQPFGNALLRDALF